MILVIARSLPGKYWQTLALADTAKNARGLTAGTWSATRDWTGPEVPLGPNEEEFGGYEDGGKLVAGT